MPEEKTKTITVTLSEKDSEDIQKAIDGAIAKFIKELPSKVEASLTSMVFQALGFSQRWGSTVEIDHCNGREPFVAQWINERSKAVCKDVIQKFDFTLSPKTTEALHKEYADTLKRHLERGIEEKAKEHMHKLLEGALDLGELKMEVIKVTKDPTKVAKPDHMAKMPSLRDLIYTDLVKDNTDAKAESDGE